MRKRPPLREVLKEMARDRSLWGLVAFFGSLFLARWLFGVAGVLGVVCSLIPLMLAYLGWQIVMANIEQAERDGYAQAKKDLAGTFVVLDEDEPEALKPQGRGRRSGLAERTA